jgi:uncharacterized membrane protein
MGYQNRLVLFATLLVVATFFALRSIGELPESVAVHFGINGVAGGWMGRESYRLCVLLFLVAFPSLLVWLFAGLPRMTDGRGQIPNSEYWFSQERRSTTESFLLSHACWLGCMTVAIVYGMHVSIMRANAISPPLLATDRVIVMLLVYFAGLGWWVTVLLRHFQRMDRNN